MGPKLSKQVLNSEKNTETKSLGCRDILVGCQGGYVQEFSIIKNKTVHDLGKILNAHVSSMEKILDKKS